ncbi:STAS domain-containing protein [Dactylosporangium sp. NPDC050688]|uniref:STAS domain-containing protein n=1 Tax=Dactylosporangium sp. NPDC050688 TaxID=3157217 RepID=UPI0033E5BD41
MDLSVTTRPGRGCLIVQAGGDLDLATAADVRQHLQQAVDDGMRVVVLDLAGVRLIDSTALGMIVWLYKQLLDRDGRVYVAAPRPMVRSLLSLTSVDRLIRVCEDVQAAEADLAAEA